jgi:hypothetical protein
LAWLALPLPLVISGLEWRWAEAIGQSCSFRCVPIGRAGGMQEPSPHTMGAKYRVTTTPIAASTTTQNCLELTRQRVLQVIGRAKHYRCTASGCVGLEHQGIGGWKPEAAFSSVNI